MTTVADGALGFFASGSSGSQIGVWSSTDGQQWTESVGAEQVISSTPGAHIQAMLAQGDAVYAAGSTEAGTSTDAALWSSSDGIVWRPVTTAVDAFSGASGGVSGGRVIYSLAPLGTTGLVAVGALERGDQWFAASWISPNGASWSQPSEAFTGGTAGLVARSVAAIMTTTGDNDVVAVGGSDTSQTVWTSADGLHWSTIALPSQASTSRGWRATLVAAGTDLVVVADGDPGQPHVLTDGRAGWSEPSSNPSVFGRVQPVAQPQRLVRDGTGLALLVDLSSAGQSVATAPSLTSEVLTSSDGRTWITGTSRDLTGSLPPDQPPGATAAVWSGSRWIAVGRTPVVVGGATVDLPVSWSSLDGVHWTRGGLLDPATSASTLGQAAAPQGLCEQASAPGAASTLVAVGRQDLTSSGTVARVWLSHDGVHWKAATVMPAPVTGGAQQMLGCLATGTGFVAFGAATGSGGGTVPAIWRSATGASWTAQNIATATSPPLLLTGLANRGSNWLAIGNPNQTDPGPVQPSGSDSLWLSLDGAASWQVLNTGEPPWAGVTEPHLALTGFASGVPIVVGTVDGRLAVWSATILAGAG
jgi:hypothetical protein